MCSLPFTTTTTFSPHCPYQVEKALALEKMARTAAHPKQRTYVAALPPTEGSHCCRSKAGYMIQAAGRQLAIEVSGRTKTNAAYLYMLPLHRLRLCCLHSILDALLASLHEDIIVALVRRQLHNTREGTMSKDAPTYTLRLRLELKHMDTNGSLHSCVGGCGSVHALSVHHYQAIVCCWGYVPRQLRTANGRCKKH